MKFNSQICTTREQSERLIALGLKKETADMQLVYSDSFEDGVLILPYPPDEEGDIPAWSLHRLIEMRLDEEYSCGFNLNQGEDAFKKVIRHIEYHIKEGHFNKEYLV